MGPGGDPLRLLRGGDGFRHGARPCRSFTDAALVATGAGALLWTFLAENTLSRRRTVAGLMGFVALEAAVFMRYTDIVMLLVAAVAAALLFRKAHIPARSLPCWYGSVALFAGGVMAFDRHFYGGALKSGYGAGEITFALRAILPNLRHMPFYLVKAMPALVLALGALIWMAIRVVRSLSVKGDAASATNGRRDAVIGLVLAIAWFGLWALYSAYTWTAQTGTSTGGVSAVGGGGAIHVIRFYLPAVGLVALLGAWLLMQLPKWLPALLLVVVATLGFSSFRSLTAVEAIGVPGNGGFPGGPPGQTSGTRFAPPNPGHELPKSSPSPPKESRNGRPPGMAEPPNGFNPPNGPPSAGNQ